MSRDLRIRYGIDHETRVVVSQNLQTGEICWPMVDFGNMTPNDGFCMKWTMGETLDPLEVVDSLHSVQWTRKIPTALKNLHREYWGLKPINIHGEEKENGRD